jgi:hypothetical protein
MVFSCESRNVRSWLELDERCGREDGCFEGQLELSYQRRPPESGFVRRKGPNIILCVDAGFWSSR